MNELARQRVRLKNGTAMIQEGDAVDFLEIDEWQSGFAFRSVLAVPSDKNILLRKMVPGHHTLVTSIDRIRLSTRLTLQRDMSYLRLWSHMSEKQRQRWLRESLPVERAHLTEPCENPLHSMSRLAQFEVHSKHIYSSNSPAICNACFGVIFGRQVFDIAKRVAAKHGLELGRDDEVIRDRLEELGFARNLL